MASKVSSCAASESPPCELVNEVLECDAVDIINSGELTPASSTSSFDIIHSPDAVKAEQQGCNKHEDEEEEDDKCEDDDDESYSEDDKETRQAKARKRDLDRIFNSADDKEFVGEVIQGVCVRLLSQKTDASRNVMGAAEAWNKFMADKNSARKAALNQARRGAGEAKRTRPQKKPQSSIQQTYDYLSQLRVDYWNATLTMLPYAMTFGVIIAFALSYSIYAHILTVKAYLDISDLNNNALACIGQQTLDVAENITTSLPKSTLRCRIGSDYHRKIEKNMQNDMARALLGGAQIILASNTSDTSLVIDAAIRHLNVRFIVEQLEHMKMLPRMLTEEEKEVDPNEQLLDNQLDQAIKRLGTLGNIAENHPHSRGEEPVAPNHNKTFKSVEEKMNDLMFHIEHLETKMAEMQSSSNQLNGSEEVQKFIEEFIKFMLPIKGKLDLGEVHSKLHLAFSTKGEKRNSWEPLLDAISQFLEILYLPIADALALVWKVCLFLAEPFRANSISAFGINFMFAFMSCYILKKTKRFF